MRGNACCLDSLLAASAMLGYAAAVEGSAHQGLWNGPCVTGSESRPRELADHAIKLSGALALQWMTGTGRAARRAGAICDDSWSWSSWRHREPHLRDLQRAVDW